MAYGVFFFSPWHPKSHVMLSVLSLETVIQARKSWNVKRPNSKLQRAWSLQLSPLPLRNEKHSRGIAEVFFEDWLLRLSQTLPASARHVSIYISFSCNLVIAISQPIISDSEVSNGSLCTIFSGHRLCAWLGLHSDLSREEMSQVKEMTARNRPR